MDGGKPQVNAIAKVISSSQKKIPVIGLAKREEEVFLPNRRKPVPFPKQSAALQLLKQTRDEAHRFAITYHRKLRSTRQVLSELDEIPGIGEQRRKLLLQEFGSIKGIKKAPLTDLKNIKGIPQPLAELIFNYFHQNKKVSEVSPV